MPWVLKPQTVVAILSPQADEPVRMEVEKMTVRLSGESVAILDRFNHVAEWWPACEEDMEESPEVKATDGLFINKRRRRAMKDRKGNPRPAKIRSMVLSPGKFAKNSRKTNKKPDPEAVAAAKSEKKKRLRTATINDPVDFEVQNCKRNGRGPRLVLQMMIKLRNLDNATSLFRDDGTCKLQHPACAGVQWQEISDAAHSYFCAERLSS